MAASYGKMDLGRMALSVVQMYITDRSTAAVLDALRDGISGVGDRIDGIPEDIDQAYLDVLVEDECSVIENALGAAFVVCQAQITAVTAYTLRTCELIEREGGSPPFKKEHQVRACGPNMVGKSFTGVEALWALANYFKHRDQWAGEWKDLTGLSKLTVDVIVPLGLAKGSTGNLRRGSEALGNSDYRRMDCFSAIIENWAQDVVRDLEGALKTRTKA